MDKQIQIIEKAFDEGISNHKEIETIINDVFEQLNTGKIRVAEKINDTWEVNQWIKKAILLSFKIKKNQLIETGYTKFYDKLGSRFQSLDENYLKEKNIRIVPQAIAREGTFVADNVVLMPSFINIGAYVDSGTMVDTWATVGSCAQIGKNVHLSGGVGIGGVLEPMQANPTIIEDNCFIGARSEIVEGVIVEKNSVISMGVYIGKSTKIYDRETEEISFGRIPEGSVVVSGSLPSKNNKYNLYCAVIVKKVDEKTRSKVSINEILRET
ncbi:MAG: 2,3,4,5-tetrahydropyridine-2,6-dicarboxylate N-succinyltransferase [Gammaproteobacteria bacterium]|nr:2,3,4,5-tetrahydropyridine-2,6-dicarboxylate N-succinyltransferase [Gammaproteobacteria bacterium]|tara:strand:+ start:633 stop:1439 length:807 start_codon:yes stop_codon:yes gene_type:complete